MSTERSPSSFDASGLPAEDGPLQPQTDAELEAQVQQSIERLNKSLNGEQT